MTKMQAIKPFATILVCGAALIIAIGGCKSGANNNAATSTTSAPNAAKAVAKAPAKAPQMTVSQQLGLTVLKAINANQAMNGHEVSVGTTPDTVILSGKVKNAAQKKLAETITRQKAKKAKVINQIKVAK